MGGMEDLGGDGGVGGGGFDGVDGGLGGVEWWRRLVVTRVFDAEGTDVEVPLCPQ